MSKVEAAKQKLATVNPFNTAAYNQAYNEYVTAAQAYSKKKSQLSNWIQARQRANYANIYGYKYTNPYLN